MPEERHGALALLLLELAAWLLAAGAFLAYYVGIAGAPPASVLAHLHLVACAWAAMAFLRLALSALLRGGAASFASGLVATLSFASLVLFYGAALVGLRSWGRVTTWDLVAAYAPQAHLLLGAMGFAPAIAAAIAAIAVVVLIAAAWLHGRRTDWVPRVAARFPRGTLAAGATLLLVVVALLAHRQLVLPPVAQQEPFSLAFFSLEAAHRIQSHGIDSAAAARREAAEDEVRAGYVPRPGARRNLVLIVADALRADHMGVYGYPRDTTPHLASLLAQGRLRMAPVVHTVCAESACGLLGLASSRYVHQFSRRMFVLHEVLSRHGYRTVMILGGDHTNFYGLRAQYGRVDSYFDASEAQAGYINDDQVVIDRVGSLPAWDGVPVLLQLHLMSPHMLGKRHQASSAFLPAENYFFPANRGEQGKPSARAINFYDNGVRGADAAIAAVLASLERKGYLADAVVAITGDHGEGLGEHGIWGHQRGVFREMLGVPLLLIAYGYPPGASLTRHALPSQVDIAPTLLHELAIPQPRSWSGRPLQDAAIGDFAFFEQGELAGLLDRRDRAHAWKYWEDRRRGTAYAFDLAADPFERDNRWGTLPEELQREWRLRLVPVMAQQVR
ncbi:MAG TPA: sulfatase-like hydrolase/transferase [Usitatibacter sp.]|nr:sulfatase-like hydrolase/transferase [Usitatibacter sp.]